MVTTLEEIARRGHLIGTVLEPALRNVAFSDFVSLLEGFGFRLIRVQGSHLIFTHPDVPELINLQEVGSQVKPYQVRQSPKLIERYHLQLQDDDPVP